MRIWYLLSVILVTITNGVTSIIYEAVRGHQVWNVDGGGGGGEDPLHQLWYSGQVDLLEHSGSTHKIRVTPERANEVRANLQEADVPFQVIVEDLTEYLQKERMHGVERSSGCRSCCTDQSCPSPLHSQYMTFEQMEWYLKDVNRTFPSKISVTSIGKSVEGRDLWLAHLKARNPKGKSVWIEAGIHAREWISSAVALHLVYKLLDDVTVTDETDVYVAPMANPDGYVYTWTTDRFWRKNRRRNDGSECVGVDLNRNWGFKYGLHASEDPCSQVYRGQGAFSEPETRALRDAMLRVKEGLTLVLCLHSYGQLLLYPWGWTAKEEAPETLQLVAMGEAFAGAVRNTTGTQYSVRNAGEDIYLASGATDDWALAILGAKYVYTLELRDKGTDGFVLPGSKIVPCSEDVWYGLTEVINNISPTAK